uniref:Uncharacterized protein n=1 Tax=Knipowitschia caucasica TaxID=637954 RepID=A0AAV2M5I8_KNICA
MGTPGVRWVSRRGGVGGGDEGELGEETRGSWGRRPGGGGGGDQGEVGEETRGRWVRRPGEGGWCRLSRVRVRVGLSLEEETSDV